jgi:hypothetical protein
VTINILRNQYEKPDKVDITNYDWAPSAEPPSEGNPENRLRAKTHAPRQPSGMASLVFACLLPRPREPKPMPGRRGSDGLDPRRPASIAFGEANASRSAPFGSPSDYPTRSNESAPIWVKRKLWKSNIQTESL